MHHYVPASQITVTDFYTNNSSCHTIADSNRITLSECAGPERVRYIREWGYDRKGNGLRV
jgi:hypothetical protein